MHIAKHHFFSFLHVLPSFFFFSFLLTVNSCVDVASLVEIPEFLPGK